MLLMLFFLETQSCFWCCKETPNSICKPHPNNYTLPNGTACVTGYCDDKVRDRCHYHGILYVYTLLLANYSIESLTDASSVF